jgi:excisionase family DNA binding protein
MSNENLVTPRAKAKATLVLQNLDQNLTDLLTVYEVAEYLRVDHVTVRKLLKANEMEAVRVVDKKILITKASLRAFLERKRKKAVDNGITDHRFVTDKFKDEHPDWKSKEDKPEESPKIHNENYKLK